MTTKLPAPLALQKYIVEYANKQAYSGYGFSGPLNTETEVDEAYKDMLREIGYDAAQDIIQGEWKTGLSASEHWSRYCEVEMVAVRDYSGNYLGFPRFYGGGKHFDEYAYFSESIENAEYLTCEEKEVLTIQRTWAKVVN
jgi:hypothetical protein